MRALSGLVFIMGLHLGVQAYADPQLDSSSTQALQDTQSLLGNPAAIQAYAKDHPDAAAANSQVTSLTGGNAQDSAAVYKLASEIFSNMTKDSNGDTAAMQKTLTDAMKNPAAFAEKLSPEQRQQLQSLTQQIESRKPATMPH